MNRLNPLTVLTVAGSVIVVVLAVNTPWLSAAVTVAAVAVGTWRVRGASVVLLTAGLVAPVAASMLLIHGPHGREGATSLVTAGGVATAGELTLRFAALIGPLLAAMTFIHIPDLVKALQVTRLDPRVAYIVGSALQFLPEGRHAVATVRDAQRLAGRRITPVTVIPRVVVPVMTQVLTRGARRAEALDVAGLDLPGRRTVLRQVPDGRAQRAVRLLAPVCALLMVVIAWT